MKQLKLLLLIMIFIGSFAYGNVVEEELEQEEFSHEMLLKKSLETARKDEFTGRDFYTKNSTMSEYDFVSRSPVQGLIGYLVNSVFNDYNDLKGVFNSNIWCSGVNDWIKKVNDEGIVDLAPQQVVKNVTELLEMAEDNKELIEMLWQNLVQDYLAELKKMKLALSATSNDEAMELPSADVGLAITVFDKEKKAVENIQDIKFSDVWFNSCPLYAAFVEDEKTFDKLRCRKGSPASRISSRTCNAITIRFKGNPDDGYSYKCEYNPSMNDVECKDKVKICHKPSGPVKMPLPKNVEIRLDNDYEVSDRYQFAYSFNNDKKWAYNNRKNGNLNKGFKNHNATFFKNMGQSYLYNDGKNAVENKKEAFNKYRENLYASIENRKKQYLQKTACDISAEGEMNLENANDDWRPISSLIFPKDENSILLSLPEDFKMANNEDFDNFILAEKSGFGQIQFTYELDDLDLIINADFEYNQNTDVLPIFSSVVGQITEITDDLYFRNEAILGLWEGIVPYASLEEDIITLGDLTFVFDEERHDPLKESAFDNIVCEETALNEIKDKLQTINLSKEQLENSAEDLKLTYYRLKALLDLSYFKCNVSVNELISGENVVQDFIFGGKSKIDNVINKVNTLEFLSDKKTNSDLFETTQKLKLLKKKCEYTIKQNAEKKDKNLEEIEKNLFLLSNYDQAYELSENYLINYGDEDYRVLYYLGIASLIKENLQQAHTKLFQAKALNNNHYGIKRVLQIVCEQLNQDCARSLGSELYNWKLSEDDEKEEKRLAKMGL